MNLPWIENPFRLWSFEDMLQVYANQYLLLGQYMAYIYAIFRQKGSVDPDSLREILKNAKKHCEDIGLTISIATLSRAINDLPQNEREWNVIVDMIQDEIKSHLFLFVPPHRAIYYKRFEEIINDDDQVSQFAQSFPDAAIEVFHAGNCFATGEYTACVFHSMRAVELGLRAMAIALNVTLSHPIELAEWQALISNIETKIKEMQQLSKSTNKDENITFYSDAASQFRYFRDAYRHHVAHARKNYEEDQAKSIMDRTEEFLKSLATKLSEPNTP